MNVCKRCGGPVIQEVIRRELWERTGDIPETCLRASQASVFCGLTCALEGFSAQVSGRTIEQGS